MSERFERFVTFGASPVNYNRPETWTDEVHALYRRLEAGDYGALAPLLKWDIEFLTDRWSIRALVVLKHAPEIPGRQARATLRRIANVIQQRPGPSRSKLPWGDRLEAELGSLTSLIDRHGLLRTKRDSGSIQRRLESAATLSVEERARVAFLLAEAASYVLGQFRKSRSWALSALAAHYDVEPKQIENRIARDRKSGRRRR